MSVQFRYKTLFTVTAQHDYFTGGNCEGMVYVPSPATLEWMKQHELIMRSSGPVLTVLFDELRENDFLSVIAKEPLQFDFYVCTSDPYFLSYTDLPIDALKKKWIGLQNSSNKSTLQKGETVTEADLVAHKRWPAAKAAPGTALTGVLSIRIDAETNLNNVFFQTPQAFTFRFAARPVLYRYLVVNKHKVKVGSLSVVAQRGRDGVTFSAAQPVTLPNRDEGWRLTTETLQPLRQHPAVIYQLYDNHLEGKGDMLIQHLPVPSPQLLSYDREKQKYVAEMIVYL